MHRHSLALRHMRKKWWNIVHLVFKPLRFISKDYLCFVVYVRFILCFIKNTNYDLEIGLVYKNYHLLQKVWSYKNIRRSFRSFVVQVKDLLVVWPFWPLLFTRFTLGKYDCFINFGIMFKIASLFVAYC